MSCVKHHFGDLMQGLRCRSSDARPHCPIRIGHISQLSYIRAARAGEWWARSDSNRGPRDYESPALTAVLQARRGAGECTCAGGKLAS